MSSLLNSLSPELGGCWLRHLSWGQGMEAEAELEVRQVTVGWCHQVSTWIEAGPHAVGWRPLGPGQSPSQGRSLQVSDPSSHFTSQGSRPDLSARL